MGIMHRDVKPHNVMIDHDNRKVLYFHVCVINNLCLELYTYTVHLHVHPNQHTLLPEVISDFTLRCLNTVCTRSTICTADVNKRMHTRL